MRLLRSWAVLLLFQQNAFTWPVQRIHVFCLVLFFFLRFSTDTKTNQKPTNNTHTASGFLFHLHKRRGGSKTKKKRCNEITKKSFFVALLFVCKTVPDRIKQVNRFARFLSHIHAFFQCVDAWGLWTMPVIILSSLVHSTWPNVHSCTLHTRYRFTMHWHRMQARKYGSRKIEMKHSTNPNISFRLCIPNRNRILNLLSS